MAAHVVIDWKKRLVGGEFAGESLAGSPGSDGASPYLELRPHLGLLPGHPRFRERINLLPTQKSDLP
jgi:hypothetical protein